MSAPGAVIIGVGDGLSAALARALASEGYALTLAARNTGKLATLAAETQAQTQALDAADPAQIAALFDGLDKAPRVVIYNAAARVRGPLTEVSPDVVRRALDITAFGAFLTAQAAARRMLASDTADTPRGTILITGASAGVKGFAQSAAFAMGKFAQRGLAQSMARELHPQGIHVAWINIDGAIRNPGRHEPADRPDSMLDPDAIAQNYVQIIAQNRSAWSDEITLRPWVETF